MTRWKAFTIHLAISLVIFLMFLGIIVFIWFPGILFSIDGGWNGLRIVLGVDVVLGPLLTLVVFKVGKPGLKFDLSCIAAAQIACMAVGIWIVYQERPIALVFAYDTFYSVSAQEFEDYDKDPGVLNNFPGAYPKLVYTELPDNKIKADIAMMRSQFIGDPLFMQTENYKALPEAAGDVFRRESNVRERADSLVDAVIEDSPACLLSRFVSAHTNGYVCFDPQRRKLTRFYKESS
ncbi:MAG: hypothetical protein JKY98_08080 [Gammaproteobacteria bacterium]|nr:hypothetical protein [Gammaproteobacteria bacterium]